MYITAKNESELAKKVWAVIKNKVHGGSVVGLVGDLGSGKTSMAKGIIHLLDPNLKVTSPTFIICKSYPIKFKGISQVNHIDLYRLGCQAYDMEVEEIIDDENSLSFIEWFDLYKKNRISADIIINLQDIGGGQRKVRIDEYS